MKKKKAYIIAIILILIILLVPIRTNLKDGGSIRYKSLIYEITKIHQLASEGDGVKPYIDGLEVKILGMTVYSETDESETLTNSGVKSYKSDQTDDTWGITLGIENVTTTGATIKCTQSGGKPTGELQTGSWYIVENWTQENGWKEMPYVIDGEIGWTSEAWMIPKNDEREWKVNWEWLYGKLPTGRYRIGKEIMDFRESGDYDTAVYYVEFNITD